MKPTLIILFLLMFHLAFGQNKEDQDSKFIIKTSPLTVLDPWNGTLVNLGAEIKLYRNISSYSQLGYYLPDFNITNNLERNKGFVLKEELKFYLNKQNRTMGDYVSLEFCFSKQSYIRTDTIDLTRNAGLKYTKTYSSERNFSGLVFQYGNQIIKWRKLAIDIYGGLGVRLNTVSCSLTDEEANNRVLGDWDNPVKNNQQIGTNVILRFNLGIKLGIKIY